MSQLSNVSYAGASAHYTSPNRRDPVKRRWEEVLSCRILNEAVRLLGLPSSSPLRVLDVGAGTGDGLNLLRAALAGDRPVPQIGYLGIDSDPEMVETANSLFQDEDSVTFVRHDIREQLDCAPFDMVMSTGAPYSHLTPDEFEKSMTSLFSLAPPGGRCVFVVDVLGRYSIEWPRHWEETHWNYSMSFLSGTSKIISDDMSFYSRSDLWDRTLSAARKARVRPVTSAFFDRSIGVGRHTATRAFNSDIPPYRTLLNEAYTGVVASPLDSLRMIRPRGDAPAIVQNFFTSYCLAWNTTIDDCSLVEKELGASPQSRESLAERLRALEHGVQRGLGVGHSLIEVLVVEDNR